MKNTQRTLAALAPLALLLLGGSSSAQAGLQVFLGSAGQSGAVAAFDESNGQLSAAPAHLQGMRFLPLDFNGRRAADELLASSPRLRDDLPGASRILLPGQLGVLYRFDRSEQDGTHTFGYLRIDPQGVVQLYAERPGSGAASDADPYTDRIALAPDSGALLTSTRPAAGGDLFEVDLLTGNVVNRTPHLPPLVFRERSLRLANDWSASVCSRAVLRSGRGPLARVVRIPGLQSGPLYTGELAMSPAGTYAMTTAGSNAGALDVWVFAASGGADKLTSTPARLNGAGFQPEAAHGPFFALSDDGQWCAWTAQILNKRELFMRRNAAQTAPPETHVTSDANFADTLEEIGVLGIFQPGRLLIAVGEINIDQAVGIENSDFFEVQVDANGAAQLTNLTQSSGQSTAPFLAPPQITPCSVRWLPAAGAFLMYDDQSGGTGRLIAVHPGVVGLQTVMNDVKAVDFIELVGNSVVVSLRLANGNQQHQLVELPADLSGPPVVALNGAADAFLQPLVARDRWIVFNEVPDLGPQRLSRVDLFTGVYETFAVSADSFAGGVGLTSAEQLVFGFTLGATQRMVIWPFGGGTPILVHTPSGGSHVLPGR